VLSLAGGLIKYLEKIKIDGPILNNVSNEITKIMRETSSEKIGILLPLTDKILDAAEKGKIKLSKSGINGDAILRDNMVLVVGKDKDDLIRKLKEVVLG